MSLLRFGPEWGEQAYRSASSRKTSIPEAIFNRTFALLALLFFAPFMIFAAIAIVLSDGGPVFYRQQRVGQGGRLFSCLKFRTMVTDADARLERLLAENPVARQEWELDRKIKSDPRITCIGSFLRKTALDELPQFINVLAGDMLVVGPRPIVPDEMSMYGDAIDVYLSVRPGITGLWQVEARRLECYDDRVDLDCRYVRNRSFGLDLEIILKTAGLMLTRNGSG